MLALFLTLACSGSKDSATDGASTEDIAHANELWAEVSEYASWSIPSDRTSTPVLSDSHSGAYVVTWFDPTLNAWDTTGVAPEGSIAVKEGFGDEAGTSLNNLTVMEKRAGYDADHADWFWAVYKPDGTVSMAGKLDSCSGCHSSAPHDYVYATPAGGS